MGVKVANNATSTIVGAISSTDTGIAVTAGTGSLFPTLGATDYFYATLVSAGGTREIVKVTARASDSMLIVRGQEGTTAQSFAAGSRLELRITAASITDMFIELDRAFVTPYDFGAAGDGIADDTAAVQAALNTTALQVYLAAGTFRITSGLTSSAANRTIAGPGYITASSSVDVGLTVTGNNNLISINVLGANSIAQGVRVENAVVPVVENCRISDLYSTTGTAAGIFLSGCTSGAVVRNNTIRNVNSVGDGGVVATNGYSRGIGMGLSTAPTGETVIENNYIYNIIGEEGDSIACGASSGPGVYLDIDLTVRGNTIRHFSRRAIKVQGNFARVLDNVITHDWTDAAQVPNAANVIDSVQGSNFIARGNILNGCNFFTQFAVFTVTTDVVSNMVFDSNIITGLTTSNTNNVFSIAPQGPSAPTPSTGVRISNNTISGGLGRAVSLGDCTGAVISGNMISVADEASTRTISLTAGAVKALITGNFMTAGVRESFIGCDGSNCVVSDNHVKSETPLFSNPDGSGNHLVANNSLDGTASFYFNNNTLVGNRMAGNYNFGSQTLTAPGPLFVENVGGPTVALDGLEVREGQIVFDSTPTAGGKIGWTAITSGDAATVTWKQFGAIDA